MAWSVEPSNMKEFEEFKYDITLVLLALHG
jgi:hypothetical protein